MMALALVLNSCEIMPRNTLKDCRQQCKDSKKSKACYEFCDCIHKQGQPLDSCLKNYENSPEDSIVNPKN
jgi:hypothetical protein